MKKFNFILAALFMIAAGCSKQEFKEAVQQNHTSVITLQATMPETTDEEPDTRATYESDGAAVSGVVMKWTAGDKLRLCFKKGDSYYHKDAEIDASNISSDGKTATFTWEMPTEIGDGDTFDFYAVFQKRNPTAPSKSKFEDGTPNYEFATAEYDNVTLNQTGAYGAGIINPALLFSAKNTTKIQLGMLKLNFQHMGWIMALHLKNSTGAEVDLPKSMRFRYPSESASSFIWNGSSIVIYSLKMDVTTGMVTTTIPSWESKQCVYFNINEGKTNPLYNQKLAAGASIVLYRWLFSTPQIEEMQMYFVFKDNSYVYATNHLPGRTVQNGKVYHTFLNWTSTGVTLTRRDGTPLP